MCKTLDVLTVVEISVFSGWMGVSVGEWMDGCMGGWIDVLMLNGFSQLAYSL